MNIFYVQPYKWRLSELKARSRVVAGIEEEELNPEPTFTHNICVEVGPNPPDLWVPDQPTHHL
ncbi:hypothetical protein XELAEV_18037651mg [Xenopus laevis]|uniref:Uncharacterized protein n=1 Tax=Xenopus laevis TaxID=8355 RepID=A0A974HAT6_XENLA|nr:hypothetical protein XELAEV_18037651mg [Xenopus laevis]